MESEGRLMIEVLQVIGLMAIVGFVVYIFDKKDTKSSRYDSKGRSYTQGEDGTRHYKHDSHGNDISYKDVDK